MTKMQISGIFLAVVMVCGSVPLGFSEPLRVQLEQGIETSQIQCDDMSHVLVQRPNGKLACVSEGNAERMNWEIIDNDVIIPVEQKMEPLKETTQESKMDILNGITEKMTHYENDNTPKLSDKQLSITNIGKDNTENMIYELGTNLYFWPQHTLSFPEEVRVGESFNVVLDYAFLTPTIDDDVNGVEFEVWEEPESVCPVEICGDYEILIYRPSNVDLINRSDYMFKQKGTDTRYIPNISGELGYVKPTYNNTAPQQEIFTFVINEPTIDYNYGEMEVSYPQIGDEKIYFYVAPDGVVHLSEDPVYMPGEGPSQLVEFHTFEHMNATNTTFSDPPDELIPDLAEFLKEFYEGHDYSEMLRESELSDKFIEKFFDIYPELKTQSFTSSLHWILPQAYGASSSFSFVYGNLKHYDSDGNKVALENIKICAYDTENGVLTELMNGRTHVCVTSGAAGYFSMIVSTRDPNGSGGTDPILKAFAESDDFVVYENNNNNIHTILSSKDLPNLSGNIKSFGDFTLSSTQNSAKAFWVIDELEPIKEWYTRNVAL